MHGVMAPHADAVDTETFITEQDEYQYDPETERVIA